MFENERTLNRMSSGDIIDYSIEVYKRNFKSVTILSLIFYVPFSFLYSIATNFFSNELTRLEGSRSLDLGINMAYFLVILFILFLYMIYLVTLNAVMESAVTKVIYDDIVYKRTRKLKTVISESFKKFPSLLGYKLLFYLILTGIGIGACFLLIIAVFVYSGFIGAFAFLSVGAGGTAGAGALAVASVILLLVMCFAILVFVGFFYIKFGFGVQSISVENRSASEGISRSMVLSGSNFWNSFWALFFGMIMYFFIPSLSLGLVGILSFIDVEIYSSINFVATTTIQVVQSLFYPFIITLMTVMFINMKINNEGLDLEMKVDRMFDMQNNFETGEKSNV